MTIIFKAKKIFNKINRISLINSVIKNIVPFIPLLIIWQMIVNLNIYPQSFVPPINILPNAFIQLFSEFDLIIQVGLTLIRVLIAALIGIILGIILGVIISINKFVYYVCRDLIDFLQAVGEIGWLPLFVIWSGFNNRTIIIVICYTVFFPVFYGTISGFRQIPKNLIDSVKTLGGNKSNLIFNVMLPGSLPSIITGFRTGVGFGWRTVILAEMLIAQKGLGVMLFNARQFFRIDWILIGMIIAGLLWLIMDNIILKPLEARTIQRWGIKGHRGGS